MAGEANVTNLCGEDVMRIHSISEDMVGDVRRTEVLEVPPYLALSSQKYTVANCARAPPILMMMRKRREEKDKDTCSVTNGGDLLAT